VALICSGCCNSPANIFRSRPNKQKRFHHDRKSSQFALGSALNFPSEPSTLQGLTSLAAPGLWYLVKGAVETMRGFFDTGGSQRSICAAHITSSASGRRCNDVKPTICSLNTRNLNSSISRSGCLHASSLDTCLRTKSMAGRSHRSYLVSQHLEYSLEALKWQQLRLNGSEAVKTASRGGALGFNRGLACYPRRRSFIVRQMGRNSFLRDV